MDNTIRLPYLKGSEMSPYPPLVAVGLHAAGQAIYRQILKLRPAVRGSYDAIKNNLNRNTRSYKYVKGECRVDRGTYLNLRNSPRLPPNIVVKNGPREPVSKPFVLSPFSKGIIAAGLPLNLHSILRPTAEKSPKDVAKADQTTYAEKKEALAAPRRPAPLAPKNILAFPHGESPICIEFITSLLKARTTLFEAKRELLGTFMGKSGASLDTVRDQCEDIFRGRYLREFENFMRGKSDAEKSSEAMFHRAHAHAESDAVAYLRTSGSDDIKNYGNFLSKFVVRYQKKTVSTPVPPPIPDRSGKLVYQRGMKT